MNQRIKQIEKEIKALKKENLDTSHLERSLSILKKEYQGKLSAWERVQMARSPKRPGSKEYMARIFNELIEFHGDRYYGDDGAVFGGIGLLKDMPVTVIAIIKGKNTEENLKANFGMPHPEGYRKALRLMKQAEKFKRPIITLIDTPGAFPGIEAEERGEGEAIAQNLMNMMDLAVPSIALILGEAGSGGALALAVSDQVWMLENAIYSILSPEGFASILFKDASRAPEVADIMKITSKDLLELGVIDEIISEEEDFEEIADYLKEHLYHTLKTLKKMRPSKLKNERYQRFRKMGEVIHER